jgi:hypothetical protein
LLDSIAILRLKNDSELPAHDGEFLRADGLADDRYRRRQERCSIEWITALTVPPAL